MLAKKKKTQQKQWPKCANHKSWPADLFLWVPLAAGLGWIIAQPTKGLEKKTLLHINNNITYKGGKRGLTCGRVAWEQEQRCSQADVWSLESDSFQWIAVISSIFTLMVLWELRACRQFHPVCLLLSSPAASDTCAPSLAITFVRVLAGVHKVTQHTHQKSCEASLYFTATANAIFFQNVSVSINFLVPYSSKWAIKGLIASKETVFFQLVHLIKR